MVWVYAPPEQSLVSSSFSFPRKPALVSNSKKKLDVLSCGTWVRGSGLGIRHPVESRVYYGVMLKPFWNFKK